MRVDAERDRRVAVAHLLTHVRDRRAGLKQQRRIRVSQIVDPDVPKFRLFEDPREHVPDVFVLRALCPPERRTPTGAGSCPSSATASVARAARPAEQPIAVASCPLAAADATSGT